MKAKPLKCWQLRSSVPGEIELVAVTQDNDEHLWTITRGQLWKITSEAFQLLKQTEQE